MSSSTLSSPSCTILTDHPNKQPPQAEHSQTVLHDSQQQISRIKQSICLSKQQLIQVVNRNQFGEKVYCFNNKARKLIEGNKIQEALVYLNEAEKILEYAASSGRNIERKTIVEVLHNQATSYQALWDLEKCSNYIQALIFNFNSELKFGDFHSALSSEIQMSASKKSFSTYSKAQNNKLQKKIELSKYYLLYCAINSQLKNNQGALGAAKKASQLAKSVLEQILTTYQTLKKQNPSLLTGLPAFIFPMLQQIQKLSGSISIQKVDDLIAIARHSIKTYNSKCLFNNLSASKSHHASQSSKQTYLRFKQFSIGNIMQLQAMGDRTQKTIKESETNSNEGINYQNLIEKLIVFSICYFTMATQLRYIALNKAKNNKQASKQIHQFKESQVYHLIAILLIGMYMPFDVLYMEHIISSYHGHYQTVLVSNGLDGTPQLTEEELKRIRQTIVFASNQNLLTSSGSKKQEDIKKCSTTNQSNQSLVVSFNYEQDEQSRQKSHKKSSHRKSSHKENICEDSLIQNHQNFDNQNNHLFDEYYYVKKNTEPQHENILRYQEKDFQKMKSHIKKSTSKGKVNSKQKSKLGKYSKSKVNTEESVSSKQKKPQRKPSRRKRSQNESEFDMLQSKPSKILIQTQFSNKNQNLNRMKSQITPQMAHSPMMVPEIYSKITKKTSSKKQKSKQNKSKKTQASKNIDSIRHQSQYFSKCNLTKKNDKINRLQVDENNPVKKSKRSKSIKKKRQNNKTNQDQIRSEYFHVHNPNIMNGKKRIYNKIANKQTKKSISNGKKQRLSSKSLQKTLSPNTFSKKSSIFNFNKPNSELSKEKKNRMTVAEGRNIGNQNIPFAMNSKRSVSGKNHKDIHLIH